MNGLRAMIAAERASNRRATGHRKAAKELRAKRPRAYTRTPPRAGINPPTRGW